MGHPAAARGAEGKACTEANDMLHTARINNRLPATLVLPHILISQI